MIEPIPARVLTYRFEARVASDEGFPAACSEAESKPKTLGAAGADARRHPLARRRQPSRTTLRAGQKQGHKGTPELQEPRVQ